ncbi:MAG: hypothetical protein KDD22_00750, partial [Bdellovibrionales bacterium]|nr:hypothetical protein [Bdellovibrionales bacterium]
NQAMRGIGEQLPGVNVINGKHLLKENGTNNAKIPDAVLEVATTDLEEAKRIGIVGPDAVTKGAINIKVAVELELTTKSDRRYREIITGYRLNRNVDRVLYLSHDWAVFRKIQSVLAGFPIKGEVRQHSGIFSFLPVSAVTPKMFPPTPKDEPKVPKQRAESNLSQDKIEGTNKHQKLLEVS